MEVRIVDDAMNDCPSASSRRMHRARPERHERLSRRSRGQRGGFRRRLAAHGRLLRKEVDGSLTFVDRKNYLIKTGGENVYPAEVEAVLARHPSVQEVCVFGVPDPHWGETIKAVIVPRAGAHARG